MAKEPAGVYLHSDGRPLLGCKIHGKSQRELRDLGLIAEPAQEAPWASHMHPQRRAQPGVEPMISPLWRSSMAQCSWSRRCPHRP